MKKHFSPTGWGKFHRSILNKELKNGKLQKDFRKEIAKKNTKTTAQFRMYFLNKPAKTGKNRQSLLKESLHSGQVAQRVGA